MIRQETNFADRACVLLVEDNDDHAILMQHSLRRWRPGWSIIRATTVSDALNQLRRHDVSLALLDLNLGETMGLESVDAFVQQSNGVPVVVLTSASDVTLGPRAVEHGAQDYLDKAALKNEEMMARIDFAMLRNGIELELKRKYRALNSVLMVLSHDLQSPPRQIESLMLELLEEGGEEIKKETREDLEFSLIAARTMSTRVGAALSLAKIGNSHLKMENLRLQDLLMEATAQFSSAARARVVVKADGPVIGDRPLLIMILENLVGNGLKFSAEVPSSVSVGVSETDDVISLEVSDTGIGMPPDVLCRIFEPGYRGQLTSGVSGSGLGLAIVSQAVEAMGGKIEASSEPGKGTRFACRFPNVATCIAS